MKTLLTKLVRKLRAACDRYLEREEARTWTRPETGCDSSCSHCGYLCHGCGRVY